MEGRSYYNRQRTKHFRDIIERVVYRKEVPIDVVQSVKTSLEGKNITRKAISDALKLTKNMRYCEEIQSLYDIIVSVNTVLFDLPVDSLIKDFQLINDAHDQYNDYREKTGELRTSFPSMMFVARKILDDMLLYSHPHINTSFPYVISESKLASQMIWWDNIQKHM